jgi:hypothetical protein
LEDLAATYFVVENGDSRLLGNVGTYIPEYTVSHA